MAVDIKYPSVTVETGPDHNPIGEDEPVFVIRGRDQAALRALEGYAQAAADVGAESAHLQSVIQSINAFRDWQDAHPDLVKIPD